MSTLVVVIAVLIIAWWVRSCFTPDTKDKVPPELQRKLDSLDATKAEFERARDSVSKTVRVDTVRSVITNKGADASKASAEQLLREAEVLAEQARQSADSAKLWHAAYDKLKESNDSLRVAFVKKDSAFQAERDTRRSLTVLYVADTLRRHQIEEANIGLRDAIRKLEKPCKIGFVKCPSRTVTMVVTAVSTAILVNQVQNGKNAGVQGTKAGFSIQVTGRK